MMALQIDIDQAALDRFCRENRIRKLSFFGSVLTEEFGPESDVDIVVEFEPGTRIGYIGLTGLEMDLSELIGREVDLHTLKGLRPAVRETVLSQAETPTQAQRDTEALHDMLSRADEAVRAAQEHDRADVGQEDLAWMALQRLIVMIGSAADRVSAETRRRHPELTYDRMIQLRDHLLQEYDAVDADAVWETLTTDLPILIRQLRAILAGEDGDGSER